MKPVLACIKALTLQIKEYNRKIIELGKTSYPEVSLLTQVHGVGPLVALTFILTLEDPHRFEKSRDAGCYIGLQPARRNSGNCQPQLHITKQGDPYLRSLLIENANHILGPFGADSDLRRWGLSLAARGAALGPQAGGCPPSSLDHGRSVSTIAPGHFGRYSGCIVRIVENAEFGDCVKRFGNSHPQGWRARPRNRWQHRLNRVTPSLHRAYIRPSQSADGRVATETWRASSSKGGLQRSF